MGNAPPSHEMQDAWENIQVDKRNIMYRKLTPIRPPPKKQVDISRYRKLTPVRRTPRQRQTPKQYPPPVVALGGEEKMEEAYPYIDKYGNCFIIVGGRKIRCNEKLLARAYEQNKNVEKLARACIMRRSTSARSRPAAPPPRKQQQKQPQKRTKSGPPPPPAVAEQFPNMNLSNFFEKPRKPRGNKDNKAKGAKVTVKGDDKTKLKNVVAFLNKYFRNTLLAATNRGSTATISDAIENNRIFHIQYDENKLELVSKLVTFALDKLQEKDNLYVLLSDYQNLDVKEKLEEFPEKKNLKKPSSRINLKKPSSRINRILKTIQKNDYHKERVKAVVNMLNKSFLRTNKQNRRRQEDAKASFDQLQNLVGHITKVRFDVLFLRYFLAAMKQEKKKFFGLQGGCTEIKAQNAVEGTRYVIKQVGETDFTKIGATSSTEGAYFTAKFATERVENGKGTVDEKKVEVTGNGTIAEVTTNIKFKRIRKKLKMEEAIALFARNKLEGDKESKKCKETMLKKFFAELATELKTYTKNKCIFRQKGVLPAFKNDVYAYCANYNNWNFKARICLPILKEKGTDAVLQEMGEKNFIQKMSKRLQEMADMCEKARQTTEKIKDLFAKEDNSIPRAGAWNKLYIGTMNQYNNSNSDTMEVPSMYNEVTGTNFAINNNIESYMKAYTNLKNLNDNIINKYGTRASPSCSF